MNTAWQGPPARVLVVDDQLSNIRVLAEALGEEFEICFADSGARALEIAAAQALDVILLDVVMPGMDGYAVLRALKAEPQTEHTPVIFVTAMDETADEERGFALGAVDYITKPVSPALVRARVRTHVELKRQRDLLARHAAIDALTGIPNRRRFDQEFDLRWRSAQRGGAALTLLLLDVDHFKQFNDHYGHGPGDDCLRRVAGALDAGCARGGDFAARYGGEEFVLLLAGEAGAATVRRLLQAVQALAIPHARSSAAAVVTVSAGALELLPGHDLEHADAALRATDALLYEAKRSGRNRCVYQRRQDAARLVIQPEEITA